ncbi:MAG: hypothetical protein F6J87_08355 [Spirulina sp. SIO3F2]|nr:hypothetical protein [Spirulina sp. SIO3F2]
MASLTLDDSLDLQPFLNNPEELLSQPLMVQLAIANHPDTPHPLLAHLIESTHAAVAEAAQLHIHWAGELTEDWQTAIATHLKTAQLGQNDRLAVELLKFCPVSPAFLSHWVPPECLVAALKNPYLPPHYRRQFLERLAQEANLEARLQVAEALDTPGEILALLLGDLEPAVRMAAACHPACAAEMIQQVEQQHQLAANWQAEPPILAQLSQSQWPWIRLTVAQNPTTPAHALAQLATDGYFPIQRAVVENPSTPVTVLVDFVTHPEIAIQEALVQHPHVNIEILLQLRPTFLQLLRRQTDPPFNLSAAVLDHLFEEAIAQQTLENDYRLRALLLGSPNTPATLLAKFVATYDRATLEAQLRAQSDQPPTTEALQRWLQERSSDLTPMVDHPHVTLEILSQLATYPNPRLQLAVARHPLTPAALRQKLYAALRHNLADLELQHQIARDPQAPSTILNVLGQQIKSRLNRNYNYGDIAIALVSNPQTHADLRRQLKRCIQQEFGQDRRWQCRLWQAIAHNPQEKAPDRESARQKLMALPQGRVLLAEDPHTPIELLGELAALAQTEGDQKLAIALVKNPALPDEQLQQLIEQHKDEQLERVMADSAQAPLSALLKILYAQPLIDRFKDPYSIANRILSHPHVPPLERYRFRLTQATRKATTQAKQQLASRPESPYLLAQVMETGDRRAKIAAAHNPKTPIAVLEALATEPDEQIGLALLNNPQLPVELQLALVHDPSLNVRSALARKRRWHPTPGVVLAALAQDRSATVRALVAHNPDTPISALEGLAADPDETVQRSLVANLQTPIPVLRRLGLEANIFNVRNPNTPGIVLAHAVEILQQSPRRVPTRNQDLCDFLKHPVKGTQLPSETLAELAQHPDPSVRYRVAQHPNTSVDTLELLTAEDDIPTLRAIAEHPKTPSTVLATLAQNPDFTIRLNVARHANTTPEILGQMVETDQVAQNLPSSRIKDGLKSAIWGDHLDVLITIARQPKMPLTAMERLARREFISPAPDPQAVLSPRTPDDVVQSLASNPSLTPELLAILIQDPCLEVRLAIIRHPNLNQALRQRLAQDPHPNVREAIATSHQIPAATLAVLSTDPALTVRQKLATHSQLPLELTQRLAADPEMTVRSAIAANPTMPATVLEQLAEDEKIEVRRAVAGNPQTPISIRTRLQNLRVRSPGSNRDPVLSPTLRGLPRLYHPEADDLPTLLMDYAQAERPFVRFVALLHPLTPAAQLTQGARSLAWLERYAVAENSATPSAVRQTLAEDANRIVRAVASAQLSASSSD